MKKLLSCFFVLAMAFSVVFIAEPENTAAQTVTVRRKRTGGLVGATARGGRYIYRKGKNGVIYVYRKTKTGTVYVGRKTYQGTKYVGKKTYQGGKYVGKKTVKGAKFVGRKTKKILVGN